MLLYQWRYEQIVNKGLRNKEEKDRNIDIVTDNRGHKIVVIHDIIFRNKQNIAWTDVEQYLRRYVGEMYTIAENGEKVYIGKDLPDEYAHSNYSVGLKGAYAKVKANAVQVIPELVELSSNAKYSENMEDKHKLDAKHGWYRYDTRFAIAVYNSEGEVERYNVFHARMVIRHDADGKKYLYDMINI